MLKKYIRAGIILIMVCWFNTALGLDPEERKIISAIKSGDIGYLNTVIENRKDVNCEFSNGKSGLYYAIKYDRTEIAKLILSKGGKPDNISAKLPLLSWAIKHDRRRIARLLIEYGADVSKTDSRLNSPLILAAKLNNVLMCKILIDRGANPNHVNSNKQKASDFTIYWEKGNTRKYLEGMEKRILIGEVMPPMHDGPYIIRESENELVLKYYEHIQSTNRTRLIEKTINYSGNDTIIKGIGWDEKSYHIRERYKPIPYKISTDAPIFAIGDVHGKFNALINLLINNKIIDANHKWIFGQGQLVFLGDVFDRGNLVTETLWFLHELCFDAEKSGGKVILLLGNHEVMALTGDHRYVNEKYDYFNQYTLTNYSELYEKNSVLGNWLRNQGAIIQINEYLFMHAGISPQFAENNYTFPAINLELQNYLNAKSEASSDNMVEEILGSYGPLWYRGYMGSNKTKVPQAFINDYLKSKGLTKMILGHNEQKHISTSYEGKIVSVDIHINEDGSSAQGLLILNNKLYRCYSNGEKDLLK